MARPIRLTVTSFLFSFVWKRILHPYRLLSYFMAKSRGAHARWGNALRARSRSSVASPTFGAFSGSFARRVVERLRVQSRRRSTSSRLVFRSEIWAPVTEAALSRRVVVVAVSARCARSCEEDEEEEEESKEVDNVAARRREKVSLYRAPEKATSPPRGRRHVRRDPRKREREASPRIYARSRILSTSLPRASSLNVESPRAPSRSTPIVYYLSTTFISYCADTFRSWTLSL